MKCEELRDKDYLEHLVASLKCCSGVNWGQVKCTSIMSCPCREVCLWCSAVLFIMAASQALKK